MSHKHLADIAVHGRIAGGVAMTRGAEKDRRSSSVFYSCLAVQFAIITATIALILLGHLISVDAKRQVSFLCVYLQIVVSFALWSWWRIKRTLFDPYSLFFLAAVLFNGGQTLLEVFGMNPEGFLGNNFSPETLVQTLYAVVLGLSCLHFGALLGVIGSSQASKSGISPLQEKINGECSRCVGWYLLGVAFLPECFVAVKRIQDVLSGGYMALYSPDKATGLASAPGIMAWLLVPGAMFLIAGSKSSRGGRIISFAAILFNCAVSLFLGTRGAALMPLVAYAWVWHKCIRPIPGTRVLLLGAILFLVVVPSIKIARGRAPGRSLEIDSIMEAYTSKSPFVSILSEMGGSMSTVAYTVDLVPAVRPYDHGLTYAYATLMVIPNIAWRKHPTVSRGLAYRWLIEMVDPPTAAAGGSIGYSFIAEPYLNFGLFGVPIVLTLVGYGLVRFIRTAMSLGTSSQLGKVGSFLAFVLVFPRAESADMVRALAWYSLIPYFAVIVLIRMRQPRTDQSAWRSRVTGS